MQYLEILQNIPGLKQKLDQVFSHNPFPEEKDPDKNLYSGGFFSPDDKQRMDQLRSLSAAELATADLNFKDQRIPEMLFRYRARNYPESLSDSEHNKWNEYRRIKFDVTEDTKSLSMESFNALLAEKIADDSLSEEKKKVLSDLQVWGEQIASDISF